MPIRIGDIKLYSIAELSKKLGVTRVTLRGYFKSGRMKGRKVGATWYVTEESLREYFNIQGTIRDESIQGNEDTHKER